MSGKHGVLTFYVVLQEKKSSKKIGQCAKSEVPQRENLVPTSEIKDRRP